MSLPTTEVVVLTLQPGESLEEPLKGLSQILRRQAGFQRFHWGRWEESPEKVQLFIDWDNINAHQDFEASGADYTAVGTVLGPILAAAPAMHHVPFTTKISDAVLIDNVSEIATFYGLGPAFESELEKFLHILGRSVGFKGVSGGSVVEELEFDGTDRKVKAYIITIFWTSVENHVEAMMTKDVKEALSLIGAAAENVEMHHVQFYKS